MNSKIPARNLDCYLEKHLLVAEGSRKEFSKEEHHWSLAEHSHPSDYRSPFFFIPLSPLQACVWNSAAHLPHGPGLHLLSLR